MHGNDTLYATARDGYEKFDCARAVALIAFIGLLSNFQDIIDEFTNNANRRRKRRSDSGETLSNHPSQSLKIADQLTGIQWEDMLYPVMKTLKWKEERMKNSKDENITGKEVENKNSVMDDEVENVTRKRSGTESNNSDKGLDENYIAHHITDNSNFGLAEDGYPRSGVERKSSLLNDFAHIGPQLAMWLVDIGDGRVSSRDGHAGVCRATQTLEKNHGWLGSFAANLLRRTLTDALAKYEPIRTLLQNASITSEALTCHESFGT